MPERHLQEGHLSERHLPERGLPKVIANEASGTDNCQSGQLSHATVTIVGILKWQCDILSEMKHK